MGQVVCLNQLLIFEREKKIIPLTVSIKFSKREISHVNSRKMVDKEKPANNLSYIKFRLIYIYIYF
jgi:CxxC motif-containing protein